MATNKNRPPITYHSANSTFEAAIGNGGKLTQLHPPNEHLRRNKRAEINQVGAPGTIDVVIVDDTELHGACTDEQIEQVLAERWFGFAIAKKSKLEEFGGYCADVDKTDDGGTKNVHTVIVSANMILKAAGLDWLVADNKTEVQEVVAEELPDNVVAFERAA